MNTINKWAIFDSGATSNSLTTGAPVTNVQLPNKPIVARLPNRDQVRSTHTCTLDLPKLPAAACLAHIIPRLALHSLVSVATLCNAGCEVLFTKIGCAITYCGRKILCGSKCMCTGSWMMPQHATNNHTNHRSALHGHGHQQCSHLHGRRPCVFYPPGVMLTTNSGTPPSPRGKLQTSHYPRLHFPPYHTPSIPIHSHQ
jgi:hypothetical protein